MSGSDEPTTKRIRREPPAFRSVTVRRVDRLGPRMVRVLFAGPDLQDALDAPRARRAIGVMPEPLPAEAPVARVTLTRAAILSARTLMITITGDEKRALLEQAITDGQSSKLPIGRVLAEAEQPIDIHWAP